MKVILFGATGMIGQGVLRECLLDNDVEKVLAIGRAATGQQHPKLRELVHADLFDLSAIRGELAGHDACFFCLGVSAAGMSEAEYRKITYELTLSVARTLVEVSPAMTFMYVSGAGTDSTEKGRSMWARVKGQTENALLKLPFKGNYMLRPGFIRPMHGITSKTTVYRIAYAILWPFGWLLQAFPGIATTTEKLGKAMLEIAKRGAPKQVLESRDLNAIAAQADRPAPRLAS
jgi:uncharacterized protein YbjT (DUF2867 family)